MEREEERGGKEEEGEEGGRGRRGRELGDLFVRFFCNVVSKLYLKFRSMEVERVPNIGKLPLINQSTF